VGVLKTGIADGWGDVGCSIQTMDGRKSARKGKKNNVKTIGKGGKAAIVGGVDGRHKIPGRGTARIHGEKQMPKRGRGDKPILRG